MTIDLFIEYCKENFILTYVLILSFVGLLVVCGAILAIWVLSKNANSEAESKTTAETQIEELKKEPVSAPKIEESPIPLTVEKANEEIDAPATIASNEECVETKSQIEEKQIEKTPIQNEKALEEKSEKKETEKKKTATKKSETLRDEDTKEKSTPKKKTPAKKPKKDESETKNENREATMLLDDLKGVETAIDFYEEDETDQLARYRGKWVICRVVTDDNVKAEDESYFFELHASNGEKLLASEEYTTYNGAIRGIETHKTNILRGNFRITTSKKGDYIFKLLSGKNLLLCMGENYPTRARCESAIESVKRFAKTAIIDENIQDHIVKEPPKDDGEIPPLPDGYNGKWIISTRNGIDGEQFYFFELFASNGEKLLSGEDYTTYIGAVNGIQTHKSNIADGNFRVCLTKRGDYIFKLLNRNGQLLCLGEHYRTKQRCLNAVESVKRFAVNSPVLADSRLTE